MFTVALNLRLQLFRATGFLFLDNRGINFRVNIKKFKSLNSGGKGGKGGCSSFHATHFKEAFRLIDLSIDFPKANLKVDPLSTYFSISITTS